VFVTSDPNGGWSTNGYYVHNNMWNVSGYNVRETLSACAYNNWYVTATMDNSRGDGAVKTYPNVHKDYNEPAISSFSSITSTFSETSPHVGIYEAAYDIWLNGVASNGSTEVMIWNDNYHQVPAGSKQATVTFDGRSYTVWRTGTYIAFAADSTFTSGTVDLLAMFSAGWQAGGQSRQLGQILWRSNRRAAHRLVRDRRSRSHSAERSGVPGRVIVVNPMKGRSPVHGDAQPQRVSPVLRR
jgi:hypothetical protein